MSHQAEIGIIGGSGLYKMPGLQNAKEVEIETPFGHPSDLFLLGELEGRKLAFLARHGRGHWLLPTEINFRANIYAFKTLGVERILSVSAVGSLQAKFRPGDMVLPLQFFDRTQGRVSTFFGDGLVAHVSFADPICSDLVDMLYKACQTSKVQTHRGGTYLCMEGPTFSTKAESNVYRSWKMDIIGMTNLQEAKLAREAEICYASLSMVTDYDCWHPETDSVTVEQVIACLTQNAENAQRILREAVKVVQGKRTCRCAVALQHAIMTDPKFISDEAKEKYKLLIGKYVS